MTRRDILCEIGLEDAVVFEDPDHDKGIIGHVGNGHVVYDYDTMVETLMEQDSISAEEAMEFIDYNTLRSLPYVDNAPIVIFRIEDYL